MDWYYGFIITIASHSFLLTFLRYCSFKLCLKAFKETDAFKDFSSLFHKKGPTYGKTVNPSFVLR